MTWEIASVIITSLIAVTVAAIKLSPYRKQKYYSQNQTTAVEVMRNDIKHLTDAVNDLKKQVADLAKQLLEYIKSGKS